VVLSGSHVHGNPGALLVLRSGAAPRITHNVFARNHLSDALSASLVVETGAAPEWSENVFKGMTVQDIATLDEPTRGRLTDQNLLLAAPRPAPASPSSGGRGR
jgi:hypothetical protein